MLNRAAYLTLGLALLSLSALAVGWLMSMEPGLKMFRLVGFTIGGMVSVPTLVLCFYYRRRHGVRSAGVTAATAISGVYAALFIAVVGVLFSKHPVASQWVMHAF